MRFGSQSDYIMRTYTKPIPDKDSCYFCKKKMHIGNYDYFLVKKATKPPRTSRRWSNVGVACDPCGESNDTMIDPWNLKANTKGEAPPRQANYTLPNGRRI